jgi:circadian clock protein KaiB
MGRKKKRTGDPDAAAATVVVMALYITDSGPNSVRAVANLEAICRENLQGNFRLEIIDVLQYPLRALADGIVVTPSLAKLSPLPVATVVGNLSDRSGVLRALGIEE